MFVKPKHDASAEKGLQDYKVYDPALKNFIPPEGREVGADHSMYWHQLAAVGDVTILSKEDAEKASKAYDARINAEQDARAAALADADAKAKEADKSQAAAPATKQPAAPPAAAAKGN